MSWWSEYIIIFMSLWLVLSDLVFHSNLSNYGTSLLWTKIISSSGPGPSNLKLTVYLVRLDYFHPENSRIGLLL